MGYAEIACCNKCEIPVKTIDESGMRHLCERCQEIKLEDDLIFLDFHTAMLHVQAIKELDKSIDLIDHTLDLLNDIKRSLKND